MRFSLSTSSGASLEMTKLSARLLQEIRFEPVVDDFVAAIVRGDQPVQPLPDTRTLGPINQGDSHPQKGRGPRKPLPALRARPVSALAVSTKVKHW